MPEAVAVGRRRGSDPALLWLWRRQAAAAPIQPLAWELPHAAGVALKRKKYVCIRKPEMASPWPCPFLPVRVGGGDEETALSPGSSDSGWSPGLSLGCFSASSCASLETKQGMSTPPPGLRGTWPSSSPFLIRNLPASPSPPPVAVLVPGVSHLQGFPELSVWRVWPCFRLWSNPGFLWGRYSEGRDQVCRTQPGTAQVPSPLRLGCFASHLVDSPPHPVPGASRPFLFSQVLLTHVASPVLPAGLECGNKASQGEPPHPSPSQCRCHLLLTGPQGRCASSKPPPSGLCSSFVFQRSPSSSFFRSTSSS